MISTETFGGMHGGPLEQGAASSRSDSTTIHQDRQSAARRHGKSITVMEPGEGEKKADPPEKVKKLFREARPEFSPVPLTDTAPALFSP